MHGGREGSEKNAVLPWGAPGTAKTAFLDTPHGNAFYVGTMLTSKLLPSGPSSKHEYFEGVQSI